MKIPYISNIPLYKVMFLNWCSAEPKGSVS